MKPIIKPETVPDGLEPKYAQLYQELIREKIALHGAVTMADLEMIVSAAFASQGEATCRRIAQELSAKGMYAGFMNYSKAAQSEHRTKSAALGRLGLTGDRRGVSQEKRMRHANSEGKTDIDDEWGDIP